MLDSRLSTQACHCIQTCLKDGSYRWVGEVKSVDEQELIAEDTSKPKHKNERHILPLWQAIAFKKSCRCHQNLYQLVV